MAKTEYFDTTEEHWKYYQGQIQRWIDFWAVYDFRIYHHHQKMRGALASFNIDHSGKSIGIALGKTWTCPVTKKLLSKCAFHEVTEIMLDVMSRWMQGNRYDLEEAVHSVVRRMENIIFDKEWVDV